MRARLLELSAASMLALQIGAALHLALVPHTRCFAHGEMIEAAPVADTQAAVTARVEIATQDGSDVHCSIALAHRQPHALAGAVAYQSLGAVACDEPTRATSLSRVFRAPLSFAPKHSPPA